MPSLGTTYNPMNVAMGRSSGSPYLWTGPGGAPPSKGPISWGSQPTGVPFGGPRAIMGSNPGSMPPAGKFANNAPASPASAAGPSGTLGPESIRATGLGPFDNAYRQNLATYAGGQFSRPGGSMSFNPTDPSTFPGNATGGGSAPVTGMPNSLMDMALSGQNFSWSPPATGQPSTATNPGNWQSLQDWMNQFLMNGRTGRMGSTV